MRVFVAGGTGVIGRRLVPQLVARGHQVTATTTDARKLPLLEELGAEGVVMNGLDAASVGEAVARARPEAVVHQMTAIAPAHAGKPDIKHFDTWFALTVRLRTEGTDHLLAAARAVGRPHVVAQSYASWNGIREGGWIKTEEDALDPHHGTHAEKAMAALHHLEQVVVAAGGAALRYWALYDLARPTTRSRWSASASSPSSATAGGTAPGSTSPTPPARRCSPSSRRPGGVYNIVDDEPAPANQWLPHLADCAGAKRPLRVPKWLGRAAAGDIAVRMMTEGRGFSNAKARRELGWTLQYPSWRQGLREGLV